MKAFLFVLASSLAFANYPNQISKLLDPNKNTVSVTDLGSVGTTETITFDPPASGHRLRVTFTPILVPPKVGDTYTGCADPCSTSFFRNWGQQYRMSEEVDSSGTPLSPRKLSVMVPMPMLVPSTPAVGAWKMPMVLVGQDGYIVPVQISIPGTVPSGIEMRIRGDNLGYGAQNPVDGKISVQVNNCAWQPLVNSTVRPLDEISMWYGQNQDDAGAGIFNPIGGAVQVLDLAITIPDGCLVTGTNTIRGRFNKTDGVTSGGTFLDFNFQSTSHVQLTQAVVSSNIATWTTSGAHGWSTGDWVYIWNAPGPRGRLNGNYQITVTDSTHFQTATCGDTTTLMVTCTAPNGTYVVPTSYYTTGDCAPPSCSYATPPAMYADRSLIPFSQFVQENPTITPYTAPGGGNATTGKTLWDTATLVLPNSPYFGYASNSSVHCGSCHFKDGSDLKYFNYSNHRIEQRSIFHGLTWQNALDIAAYIRGISITVPALARPWSPPLQPFPGLDAAGIDSLLAGAGLDTYTMYDKDLLEFWTPGGSFASWQLTYLPNLRELPYWVQFLTWNKWLAAIHPSDFFPNFASSLYGQCPDAAYANVTPGNLTSFFNFSCAGSNHYMIDIGFQFKAWQDTVNQQKFNPIPVGSAGFTRPSLYTLALYSSGNWGAVKMVEITKLFGFENNLDTQYTSIFGASTNGYYSKGYIGSDILFKAALHLNSIPPEGVFNNTHEAWAYSSNSQYLVTAVADCGNRQGNAGPIDTNYLTALMADSGRTRSAAVGIHVDSMYMGQCDVEYPFHQIVWAVNSGVTMVGGSEQNNMAFWSLADRVSFLTGLAQTWTATLNALSPSYWLGPFSPQPATCCTANDVFQTGGAGALNYVGPSIAWALPVMKTIGVDNTTLTNLANAIQTIYPVVNGNDNFITKHLGASCTWQGPPNSGFFPARFIVCDNAYPH